MSPPTAKRLGRGPWLWFIAGALCIAGAMTWRWYDKTRLRWTEDVRLPDGRVVTLTRYQEFFGPYTLGDTPTESDYWFEFKHPSTGAVVRWDGKRELATVALMMRGETPVLLVTPQFDGGFRYDCPEPSYLLFEFKSNSWQRVPLATIPVERLRSNMTYAPKSYRDQIEAFNRKLDADAAARTGGRFSLADIDFGLMKEQLFGQPNGCDRERDYLQSPKPPGY
jgi:hypothetical protein